MAHQEPSETPSEALTGAVIAAVCNQWTQVFVDTADRVSSSDVVKLPTTESE